MSHKDQAKSVTLTNATRGAVEDLAQTLQTSTVLRDVTVVGVRHFDLIDIILQGLERNNTLTSLLLPYNKINDVRRLADHLVTNNTLRTLNLRWNEIDHDHMSSLYMVIERNTSLTSLDLSYNKINVSELFHALKSNNSLTSIALRSCDFGLCDASSLAEVLLENKTLQKLNLGDAQLPREHEDEIHAIVLDTFKTNETIVSLHLDGTMSNDHVMKWGDMLQTNHTLKVLNLSVNTICDSGAQALADALKVNNTLEEIYLNDNYITDTGFIALAEALEVNDTLESVELYDNIHNTVEGTLALVKSLEVNTRIYCIGLNGHMKIDALEDLLQRNIRLHELKRQIATCYSLCVSGVPAHDPQCRHSREIMEIQQSPLCTPSYDQDLLQMLVQFVKRKI